MAGSLPSFASWVWQRALALLAPADCAGCGASLPDDAAFCAACRAALVPSLVNATGLRSASLGRHAGPLKDAVHALKYRERADLAPRLGRELGAACALLAGDAEGITLVPVPLHALRLAERGYNQAALLARGAARSPALRGCRVELALLGLARTRVTAAQATLSGSDRRENPLNAFRVRKLPRFPVILVDDVCTTGATAAACADAFRRADQLVLGLVTLTLAGSGAGDEPPGSPPDAPDTNTPTEPDLVTRLV